MTLSLSKPSAAERRGNPRFPFTAAAEVTDIGSGTLSKARTGDVSLEGCYLDMNSPFRAGAVVSLRLTYEKKSVTVKGLVTSSQNGMGMGVKFVGIEPDQAELLQKWIENLSAGLPAEAPAAMEEEAANRATGRRDGVLNDLIVTLVRKGILTDNEGRVMLQTLTTSHE